MWRPKKVDLERTPACRTPRNSLAAAGAGVFRVPGTGRKVTASFEYEYEAEVWAAESQRRAEAVAAAVTGSSSTPPAVDPAPPISPAGSRLTVYAHGAALIDRRSGRLADATIRNYRTHLAGLVTSGIGDRAMSDLRRSDVERWVTAQVRDGAGKSTINARLKLLRMAILDARGELLLDHDPAAGVEYLTLDLTADRVLTAAEESALLLACPPPLDLAAIVALDAGLRWSEVYGLAVDGIAGPFLTVRQVNERTTRRIRRYPKGHRLRVVPMTARLADAIAPAVVEARRRGGADALLFVSSTGGPVSYESWRKYRWTRATTAAGLTPAPGFHALRHTYGTRLAAAGVPRLEIAGLLGHADEETTKRYIHATDDGRRLELIRDALGPRPAGRRAFGA